MSLNDVHSVYFIGIGGIGMSALARFFKSQGKEVLGYDKTQTALTMELESEGISVVYSDEVNLIPQTIKEKKEEALIVYTPAIPATHLGLQYFIDKEFRILKRAQVLGLITREMTTLAVAGTHGKTTTSSILAHLLHESGVPCTAFIGGIAKNFDSNLLLSEEKNAYVVVEADEYDRSFLNLSPDMAIVTTTDADHLDIYENQHDFGNTFIEFCAKIADQGLLVRNENVDVFNVNCRQLSYGKSAEDVRIENVKAVDGEQRFDYLYDSYELRGLSLKLPGNHNVANAAAAITVALNIGVSAEQVSRALANYSGVKRRFEYILKEEDLVYIDDYAHHPTELKAFIESVRLLFPDKKFTLIFQPHLYSRTRDFMKGFALELAKVDELILLDIYPARELPIEGVTAARLLDEINLESKSLVSKSELIDELETRKLELVATVGAGDIDQMVSPIQTLLEGRQDV